MTTAAPTLATVFAELYRVRNRRGTARKLNAYQVAETLGADVVIVRGRLDVIFMAELAHMDLFRARPEDTCYTWHFGLTARAGRILKVVGLDGVTDEVIKAEYDDAMAWRPRKVWAAPAPVA